MDSLNRSLTFNRRAGDSTSRFQVSRKILCFVFAQITYRVCLQQTL